MLGQQAASVMDRSLQEGPATAPAPALPAEQPVPRPAPPQDLSGVWVKVGDPVHTDLGMMEC
jgi:hypothetical protein